MSSKYASEVTDKNNERSLWIGLILTTAFLMAEVVRGVMINSLALVFGAARRFTDCVTFAASLVTIRIGRCATESLYTFGYYRFESLAAAFNTVLLCLVAKFNVTLNARPLSCREAA